MMLNIQSVNAIEIIVGVRYSVLSTGLLKIPSIITELRMIPQMLRNVDITPPKVVSTSE